jgi:molecular chaperone GrpE
LRAANAELKDRLLRALAECENVRRRGEHVVSDARRSAIAKFAREILTVADNLHRAIEAVTPTSSNPATEASLIEGVRATERTLAKALEKFGVQRIRALGVAFDPELHEAVQQSPDEDHPPGTIIEVLEEGYTLDDRLLRPTRAVVAGNPEQPPIQAAQG